MFSAARRILVEIKPDACDIRLKRSTEPFNQCYCCVDKVDNNLDPFHPTLQAVLPVGRLSTTNHEPPALDAGFELPPLGGFFVYLFHQELLQS